MTEKYKYPPRDNLLMDVVDLERLTFMRRNGEFLLHDPERPVWFKIPPMGALLLIVLREKDYPTFFVKELLNTTEERAEEILNEFVGSLERKMKDIPPRKQERGLNVEANLTTSCTLKCRYCYLSYVSSKLLTTHQWMGIVDSAAQLNLNQLTFSGGEPLLREDLFEIATFAHDLPLRTHLLSNGLIPKSRLSLLAQCFDSVQISIDGFSQTQEYLRGAPFDVVIENMKALVQLGIPLKAGITLTSVNISEVLPLIQWLSSNGITQFHLSLFKEVGKGRNHPELSPSAEAVVRLFLEILELGLNVDTLFHLMPRRFEKKVTCGAGTEVLSIMPDGDVYPCDALISKEFFCGSAVHEELPDIYANSPTLEKLRTITVDTSALCSVCDFRYLCGGGCISESFLKKGKIELPGPDCVFRKRFYEEFIWIA